MPQPMRTTVCTFLRHPKCSICLPILVLLVGCREPRHRTIPTSVPVSDLTGAFACAECHAAIYESWRRSPHGRAMALPAKESVLGDFTARPITLPDGVVTLGADWSMSFGGERHAVDLVLASG